MREGHDYTTPARDGGRVGCLCSHKLVLPTIELVGGNGYLQIFEGEENNVETKNDDFHYTLVLIGRDSRL